MTDSVSIVAAGYDAIASRYLAWGEQITDDPKLAYLAELDGRLADGSHIVDLGCGAGTPTCELLAHRHTVLGVDVSGEQIRLARSRVPAARFEQRDLTALDLPSGSLDAVIALYSLIHVPRERHADLLVRIRSWLRPGGLLLATFGTGVSDGVQDDFLGVAMYFSSFDVAVGRRLVLDAGFTLVHDDEVTIHEPSGPVRFLWILARA
ncbi:MAG: class I SAM-dependent methyltransferase [Actinomycetota bacterium]|nr:class I SAM-dependent methyltransferase [Actinomycetota bacterium]